MIRPEIFRALASEAPPTKVPPWVAELRMLIVPVSSATPVPVCCTRPSPALPKSGPLLVPKMKLLATVRPPATVTMAPLPEAMVTSPVPKASAVLARTLKRNDALPPVISVPPV